MGIAELITFFADTLPPIFIFIVMLAVINKLDQLTTRIKKIFNV